MSMTPKQLIEAVYEIAFGEDAHLRGFYPEEVIERSIDLQDSDILDDYGDLLDIHTILELAA